MRWRGWWDWLSSVATTLRWRGLLRAGLANRRVDRSVGPVGLELLAEVVSVRELDLAAADLSRLIADPALARFRGAPGFHYKPVEYLASLRLLSLSDGEVLLDAAGGPAAEFPRLAARFTGCRLQLICQDARLTDRSTGDVRLLGGDMTRIDLPDASVDAITCHQAFQLLRGDADRRFLDEAVRLLAPGGRLVITPLLVGSRYAEIRNSLRRPRGVDPVFTIHDPTAACAGWGQHSGFSRVLDVDALRDRLGWLPEAVSASVHAVLVDGEPAPDVTRNPHLPAVNHGMRALVIRRRS